MKIVFFNRFFHPNGSATSQMLSDLAFELARRGFRVAAVTTYETGQRAAEEVISGVEVHRVARSGATRSLLKKAWQYTSYYIGARSAATRILAEGDVAICMTDPPMLNVAVGPIAASKHATLVNWLQDVFPEIAQRYGIPGAKLRVLRDMRDRWIHSADHTVVIGETMRGHIVESLDAAESGITTIANWANGAHVRPLPRGSSPLAREWGLEGRFVVGYSGNLGRVHEFETLLRAAAELRDDGTIQFLFVGSGPQHDRVRARAAELRLPNVRFEPAQARSLLTESLAVPDVHLCVLRPEFEGLVVPSKLYGIMAAGRPCVNIGDPKGEVARVLTTSGAGLTIETGDSTRLAKALRRLASDPDETDAMGARARQAFELSYDFPVAAAMWERLISSLHLKS